VRFHYDSFSDYIVSSSVHILNFSSHSSMLRLGRSSLLVNERNAEQV